MISVTNKWKFLQRHELPVHGQKWFSIRVVIHRSGLSSRWSFIRVIFHQDGLSSGWSSVMRVFRQGIFHQGDLSSGWYFIRVSGWSFIRVVFHQGDLLSWWSFIGMVFHQDGLSSGWSFVRVIFHQGDFFYQDGLSSGWSFIRVIFYQGGLSSGWSVIRVIPLGWSSIRVVLHHLFILSEWSFIGVVFLSVSHQDGLTSGGFSWGWSFIRWSSIRLVFLSSSGWSFTTVIFHEDDPSVVWSSNSIRQVFQQGFCCTNYFFCLAVDSLTSGCGLTTVHAAISCIIALGLDGEHMCFIVARVHCSSLPL